MLSTLTWIRPGWCRLSCRQSTIDWRTVRAICRAEARVEVVMSTLTWVSARPVGPGRWVTVMLSESATVAVSGPGPGSCCLVAVINRRREPCSVGSSRSTPWVASTAAARLSSRAW